MNARFSGKCRRCGILIPKGGQCEYDPKTKTIAHFNCPGEEPRKEDPKDSNEALAQTLGFVPMDYPDDDGIPF